MCQIDDKDGVKVAQKRWKVWKMFFVDANGQLHTPFYPVSPTREYDSGPDEIVHTKKARWFDEGFGYHAFTNAKNAEKYADQLHFDKGTKYEIVEFEIPIGTKYARGVINGWGVPHDRETLPSIRAERLEYPHEV